MKILFLIFSFNTGGSERLLIDICNTMVQKGNTVSLCVINADYENYLFSEFDPNIQLILLKRPRKSRNRLSYMMHLAHIIRSEQYDILHCQDLNCVIFSLFAKMLFPRIKVLHTVHDVNMFVNYNKFSILLHNLICSHIIAISDAVKREILSCGIKPSKVTIIYNAINTNRFHLCDHPHIIEGQPRPIDCSSSINLGNVARIIPSKKGQLILLQAINVLKEDYPNIHCFFAGDVALHQEKQFQELLDYVQKYNLEKHVTFLKNVRNIPEFLKDIDIFILPSFYEGFGIALIEALATGIPCVASKLDGPLEIIKSNQFGLLFSAGDSAELAKCIAKIIQNYTSYHPYAISEYIQQKYSITQMTEALLELYQNIRKTCKYSIMSTL